MGQGKLLNFIVSCPKWSDFKVDLPQELPGGFSQISAGLINLPVIPTSRYPGSNRYIEKFPTSIDYFPILVYRSNESGDGIPPGQAIDAMKQALLSMCNGCPFFRSSCLGLEGLDLPSRPDLEMDINVVDFRPVGNRSIVN